MNQLKLHPFIFLAPLCISSFALADDYQYKTPVIQKVYEGTLGKSKIVLQYLEATQDGEKFHAVSYFYASQRLEIPLTNSKKSPNSYEEYSGDCYNDVDNCKLGAKIELVPDGNNLRGVWKAENSNKTYAISLKPVATASFTQRYKISEDADILSDTIGGADDVSKNMFKRKMALGEIIFSKEKFLNGYGYKTATDKQSGISYPILTTAPNGQNLATINAALTNVRLTLVGYGLQCKALPKDKNPAYGSYGDWDSYTSEPVNINDRILVIEESGSTFCGGAHPNNSYLHAIFDMKTGKLIYHNELFKLYYEQDYNKYKTPEFKTLFNKIIGDPKYVSKNIGTDDEFVKECINGGQSIEDLKAQEDETDYSWMPFTAYPSKNGVVLALENVPHVMGGCMGDYYEIPYKDALPLMTPLAKKLFAKELGNK
jgi:hypothetical protein